MTVVFATLGTGLMLNQDITSGVFDRFRSLPIARSAGCGTLSRSPGAAC
jgi:oleandomycin transport system permease protein